MTVSDWGSRVPCLSLMQPHASLVIWDEKHVETRDWGTNYRGTLAIHASKGWGKDERALVAREPFAAATRRHGKRYAEEFPVGVLLGVVELVAVKRMGATEAEVAEWLRRHAGVVTEQEFAFGAYGEGRVGWFMAKPRVLREPIEMRGQVGLFALAPEIATELRRRLDEGQAVSPAPGRDAPIRAGTRVVNLYDAHTRYVGRAGRGQDGYFGNYAEGIEGPKGFRAALRARVLVDPVYRGRILAELAGEVLACPGNCKGRDGAGACHGDVYVEFIEECRAAQASPGARADDARREAFEERAGILEFDAGLPRAEAERQAKEMTT